MDAIGRRGIHVSGLADLLARLGDLSSLDPDQEPGTLVGFDPARDQPVLVRLPPALGPFDPDEPVEQLIARCGRPLGTQLVLLVQAGASALGVWQHSEMVAHKVVKKYVVRGHGKAQPLHLKTHGKSRYGSRLRLQNANRQLDETVAKVQEWRDRCGSYARVFFSCPVRSWAVFRPRLEPCFEGAGDPIRIATHVHVPDYAELLRIRGFLEWGFVDPCYQGS